jgi:hypothetical protein
MVLTIALIKAPFKMLIKSESLLNSGGLAAEQQGENVMLHFIADVSGTDPTSLPTHR